ncbi:hypothetical protein DSL72_001071 [Monilinia vaccinii-corymbosi]|uniref:Manganese lipoxygenase n=1 Tax=Monilinia vaccinii-corymbosi TaxID=61207 RepID=A0A8A3P5E6_9HELO|nr:hypothetical protein DSL72_001071 [Monilinia vaccinii-corymbosi]
MSTSRETDRVNGTNGTTMTNGSTVLSPEDSKMVNGTKEKKPNIFRKIIRRPKKTQQPKVSGTIIATPAEINEATAKLFTRLEERYADSFRAQGFEADRPCIPRKFETQRALYQWALPGSTTPPYPPHLKWIPLDDRVGLLKIFNLKRLVDFSVSLLPRIPPEISYLLFGDPCNGTTMGELEKKMMALQKDDKNIGTEPSIGYRKDWYSDAVFAQQYFTGPNPSSITLASQTWIERFKKAAFDQSNKEIHNLLETVNSNSLYVQDCSFFRGWAGASPESTLISDNGKRFGCASVTLLHLNADGDLHPLAIILDYRLSMESSVTIFNRRINPQDPKDNEHEDWPWRYAKMCSLISDWTRHELTIHLNDCHFVEEVIAVAANRSFPSDHIVYMILEPHWFKTLSVNAAARATLVPELVNKINGFSEEQNYQYILSSYKHFNWTGNYVPTSLITRGFPLSSLNDNRDRRFHNYAYGKNMSIMWPILFEFVSSMLATYYTGDADVQKDSGVSTWCNEMQSPAGGQMPTFPTIRTLDELANAITMCIHIASPQHSAINYLQNYYMSFIPNKPPSLQKPPPESLSALQRYREIDVINALPGNDPSIWIQSSQAAYLLSSRVAEDQTLSAYARELRDAAMNPRGRFSGPGDTRRRTEGVRRAAEKLLADLDIAARKFKENSEAMSEGIAPYYVMDPGELAVSALI